MSSVYEQRDRAPEVSSPLSVRPSRVARRPSDQKSRTRVYGSAASAVIRELGQQVLGALELAVVCERVAEVRRVPDFARAVDRLLRAYVRQATVEELDGAGGAAEVRVGAPERGVDVVVRGRQRLRCQGLFEVARGFGVASVAGGCEAEGDARAVGE